MKNKQTGPGFVQSTKRFSKETSSCQTGRKASGTFTGLGVRERGVIQGSLKEAHEQKKDPALKQRAESGRSCLRPESN